MLIEIKDRFTGEVLHKIENNSNKIDLENKYLRSANFAYAFLKGANLEGSDLQDASFKNADLENVNLKSADLRGAILRDANLKGAHLQGAYLQGADLRGADLGGAYLQGVSLKDTGLYQIVGCGKIGRCTTYDSINNKIICGCFYGSLQEFKERVIESYQDEFKNGYSAAIAFFETIKNNKDAKIK